MHKTPTSNLALAFLIVLSLSWRFVVALPPQDIARGSSAFQGQDIMGGAAVIFKRPQGMRDLVGGAGLAIVKKCVEMHGGSINLTSQEGVGTVFTVTIPAATVKSQE